MSCNLCEYQQNITCNSIPSPKKMFKTIIVELMSSCLLEEDAGAEHLICTGLASEPFLMISHQRSLFTTVLATFRSGHSV